MRRDIMRSFGCLNAKIDDLRAVNGDQRNGPAPLEDCWKTTLANTINIDRNLDSETPNRQAWKRFYIPRAHIIAAN